ncbi:RNA exonuclease 1 homolog [Diabrotica virgifera virgifera]|uniref:RNA exonuclease 1 homolog n=1 Tax=Diabrotica virgifera virgifera TaxID=50390 RepID=A0A6P7FEV3_DIAVI|nr:RNA exonuclease 1 homolog [Diabrotica virgifera virgifera]
MLPTKGYFQDIECPYYNSSCGRPYCHFRHRKKEEKEHAQDVPTYKPTPKSELANIQSNRSHIPISYVPDLAFRPDKKLRPTTKIDTYNPTYKPTPLSILSSVKTNKSLSEESKERIEVINEIKQNIANVEYDPTVALNPGGAVDFDDLTSEFDLIADIIQSDGNVCPEKLDTDLKTESNDLIDNTQKNEDSIDTSKDKINKQIGTQEDYSKTDKTEKSSKLEQLDVKKDEKGTSLTEKHKNDIINKTNVDSKNSSQHKKHKKDKRNSSSSDEKRKDKTKSSDKNKEKDSNSTKKDKDGHSEVPNKSKKESKNNHSSSKDKHKEKEIDKYKNKEKSRSESSRSKEEKRNSDKKHDKVDYKKNKEKEKNSKKRSRSKSRERKSSSNKEQTNKRKERSRSRSKDKKSKKAKRSRSRSKERRHSKDEDKRRKHGSSRDRKNQEKEKSKHNKSEEHKNKHSNKIDTTHVDDGSLSEGNILESDSDIEMDRNETLLECYKIFNEYKPEETVIEFDVPQKTQSSTDIEIPTEYHHGKKRIAHASFETLFGPSKPPVITAKPKTVQTPGQTLANRYKLAKQAQANREQELLINEVQQTVVTKRPAPSLLEAARERKKIKEMERPKSINLVDDILKGSKTLTYGSTLPKLPPKKITPVHNAMAITKAKEKISLIKPVTPLKTVAQTQKGSRVAHVPDISLSDIPDVLQAESSKLPVNVRSRYLTMIADECVKMYISKEEAYSRALKEEFNCYEKCKVITTYRNSAMLAVNRLRKEGQERNKNGLGLYGLGEDSEGGSTGPKLCQFYNQIKKWTLTDEELDIHGYPRQTSEYGVAEVRNFKSKYPANLDENQRICSRCKKLYQVDDDGWPLFEEECCYHPLKKRTIRGEQTYLCCRSSDETGCATSDTHVCDGFDSGRLEGFQTTMDSDNKDDPRSHAVYALDCEMCYTTKGLELTRVTIVDIDCKTVYESLVKPLNPIIDYNTRFSGITKEQMDKTSTSILQVQANILHLCNSMTILVGHSLESDMKALKIVHGMIVDTSVLFPHKMGLPHKRALKVLASEHLRKIIQNDVSGHDSAEDAITCMELLKWKIKEESKLKH